jgi:hypothetical protein
MQKNNLPILLILTFNTLLLSACATITTGQKQTLSIANEPEVGAICELTNDKGK